MSNPDKASSTAPWKYDRKLPSDPNICPKVIELLLDRLAAYGWGNKDTFGIHMATEEAIMNAICHGNEKCDEKRVHVVIALDEHRFFARVSDEGCGFDPDDLPDPTDDENVTSTSGRGVMLIRHFVDSVQYNDVGNVVELKKQKTGH